MSIESKLASLSDAQLGRMMRNLMEGFSVKNNTKQEEPEDEKDDELQITPTSKAPVKAAKVRPEYVAEPAKKNKSKRPMDESFIDRAIFCLDKQWGTVVGMDEERRMWKVRATLGRGRPRLVPEALIEMTNFKAKNGVKRVELIERTAEYIADKMAA